MDIPGKVTTLSLSEFTTTAAQPANIKKYVPNTSAINYIKQHTI